LDIPSVGISNFTWYTTYQDLIDDKELKTFKEAYQKMTYFFSLAGSNENWNMPTNDYEFFSREMDPQEVQRIRGLVNPNDDMKIIFLGLGMKINVDSLDQLPIWDSPNCVFVVSSNAKVNRSNVFQIPTDYLESQNYIAASDLVISKAGWGMIGEALTANVPLLILNRPSMKEDQNTINYLKQHHLCETIEWEDFKFFQVNLPKKLNETVSGDLSNQQNQSEKIAEDLLIL
jgi:UDP-N-acetylglucosamine transferase subunit ALG13